MPPLPAVKLIVAPLTCDVVPLPMIAPVPDADVSSVTLPAAALMVDPLASEIFPVVVRFTEPVPVTARLLVAFGRLIVPVALAERLWLVARVRPPARLMVAEVLGLVKRVVGNRLL